MSERPRLSEDKVSEQARAISAGFHKAIVDEVAAAVARDKYVIVGMAQNPFVKKARALLTQKGIAFTYIEHGSYLSKYRERLAIKMWAGFPTFPMVFVDGVLIGGHSELVALEQSGKLGK